MDRRVLYALVGLATVLLAFLATQVLVPSYLERRAEKRLTEDGGEATVDIDALPALRLLFDRGQRITVRGSDLDIPLESERGRVFDDLDRFAEADVRLDRLTAGPLRIARFSLTRDDHGDPYLLAVSATTTVSEVSAYAGQQFGPFAEFLGRIGSALLPGAASLIPVELDAEVESDDGLAIVHTVDGTVAGVPADPLVRALAAAIAKRL